MWSAMGELRLTGGGTWREQVSEFFGISDFEAYSLTRATWSPELDAREYDTMTTKRQFCARLRRLIKTYAND